MQVYRSVGQRRPRRLAVVLWYGATKPSLRLPNVMPCAAMRCDAMRHTRPASSVARPPSQLTEKSNSIAAARPLQLPQPTAHTVYRTCCMHTQPNTYAQRVCVREAVKQAGSDDLTSLRHIATLSAACATLVT